MITYMTGDILKSTAKAIVNPVNLEGIMGKGLAKQIKKNYPNTYKSYLEWCKTGKAKVGRVHTFYENGKIIINLPTKVRWSEPSPIDLIEVGLDELIRVMKALDIYTIAIPALGCGNGGLSWADVKPLMDEKLTPVYDRVFQVYEPH